MTPVQVLADTLQVDPTRIEAALKGHGLTVVHTDPLARLWAASYGAWCSVGGVDLYGDDPEAAT